MVSQSQGIYFVRRITTYSLEQKLIEKIKSLTGDQFVGDDCAVLPAGLLVTSDTLVETTHFRTELTGIDDLGFKAVAVNLSDVAAMGGRPRYIIVNLTLPPGFSESDFLRLYRSIQNCAQSHRARIAGGDLTAGPVMSITITVLADAHECGVIRRAGAGAGDVVIATGDFGASAAGLWCLENRIYDFDYVIERHNRPSPRLQESWAIVELSRGYGAMMDASDGLADALYQISSESNKMIEVEAAGIPIHRQTMEVAEKAGVNPLDWALYGGEDYELVACVSKSVWHALESQHGNPFVPIGKVSGEGSGVTLEDRGAKHELDMSRAYMHWS